MTVDWICTQCGKQYQHPTFVIWHITREHLNGEAKFEDVAQWILVRAVGALEEE